MKRLEETTHGTTSELNVSNKNERFNTPEEELAYLKERVRIKEDELETQKTDFERGRIAKREIVNYQDTPAEHVLHDTYKIPEVNIMQETLRLEPEEHDAQVDELLKMVKERGIRNTLSVVSKMGSAHLEDDIHRALIQYVANGFPTKNIKQGSDVWNALHKVLYEVALPAQTAEDKNNPTQDLEKLLSAMEQFYSGMLSVVGSGKLNKKEVFSVEIAVQQGSEEAIFYVSVPKKRSELFKKHLISIFPNAQVEEIRGDYNIFNYGGAHAGAYGTLKRSPVYPLKDYKTLTHDPLNVIMSAFSNMQKHTEGAAIQFIIGDNGDLYNKQYKKVLDHLREGKKIDTAIKHGVSPFSEALDMAGKSLVDAVFNKRYS